MTFPADTTKPKKPLPSKPTPPYSPAVAANSAAGFGDPINHRRTSAASNHVGAFFVPAGLSMAAVRGIPSGMPGSFGYRFANLRTAATHSFGDDLWRFLLTKGISIMTKETAVTTLQPFDTLDSLPLFSVNAGVPVEDALERATDLMAYAEALAAADALVNKTQERALIQHLSEMAKALTKACQQKAA
jgi:hypothetical protein